MKNISNLFLLAMAHFIIILDQIQLHNIFLTGLWTLCLALDIMQLVKRRTIYKKIDE